MSWLVRTARHEDARIVSELYRESWPSSVDHVASDRVIDALLHERSEGFWSKSIQDLSPRFYLATDESRIMGFCGWKHRGEQTAELEWLFVSPSNQRVGIGSGLHDHALEAMFESEVEYAYLWAIPGNRPAEEFYRGKGWHSTQEFTSVVTKSGRFLLRRWICSLPSAVSLLRGL
jgi:GNAT superfamily N-acetyltransferase